MLSVGCTLAAVLGGVAVARCLWGGQRVKVGKDTGGAWTGTGCDDVLTRAESY